LPNGGKRFVLGFKCEDGPPSRSFSKADYNLNKPEEVEEMGWQELEKWLTCFYLLRTTPIMLVEAQGCPIPQEQLQT